MSGATKTAFAKAIAAGNPVILDGGLATQLEAQGCDIANELWSASLLVNDPEAIVQAHGAYLDAGAECIATASYQATRRGFATLGLSARDADERMLLSVDLARRARDEFLGDNPGCDRALLVAASIGPYGAALHDGSEYTGDYGIGSAALEAFHADRIALFDNSDADVLALETIPSLPEAQVLAGLLRGTRTPAWVSFSCRGAERLSDGASLHEAACLFRGHPTVLAVGVNCTSPAFVPSLIRIIRNALPEKAAVAYPNSGEVYDATQNCWSGTASPLDCAAAALDWVDAGALLVGGCCRMGPEHIRAMASGLRETDL